MSNDTHAPGHGPAEPISLLSYTRALYSHAKIHKKSYWKREALASGLSVLSAFSPWWWLGAIFVVLGVLVKVLAKSALSEAKSLFRRAERGRRYDFEERNLGWAIPPNDRADMRLASPEIEAKAREWQKQEAGYFASEGPPSTARFLSNLAESIFWSEKLMEEMAKRRWWQLILVAVATFGALVATALIQPGPNAALVLKVLAVAVLLLVTLDVFGEWKSFQRGEKECGLLLSALVGEAKKTLPDEKEVMRIFVEYNCLLVDVPMIPDEVYNAASAKLNQAWAAFRSGLLGLA